MTHVKPEWVEYQRKRWLRNNARLWIRPDAHRFLRPDYRRFMQPGAGPWSLDFPFEGKANFNPDQPRVSAGNPGGGRWTAMEAELRAVAISTRMKSVQANGRPWCALGPALMGITK